MAMATCKIKRTNWFVEKYSVLAPVMLCRMFSLKIEKINDKFFNEFELSIKTFRICSVFFWCAYYWIASCVHLLFYIYTHTHVGSFFFVVVAVRGDASMSVEVNV